LKNKHNSFILLGTIALLVISLFLYLSTFVQPKITFTAQINNISAEDYKRIMDNAKVIPSDKSIEKFKRIDLKISIVKPMGIIRRAYIENIPSQQFLMKQYLIENHKIRIVHGDCTFSHSGMDYSENVEVYLNDITEDELKTILGNFKVVVLWQNIWGNKGSKILYLKDYLR
jgi:competence CoiA-like predicted nuclease